MPYGSVTDPPTPRLEVGDTVTFDLEATDPRGRELIWRVYSIPSSGGANYPESHPQIAEAIGNRVQIVWTVCENDVGEHRYIVITVANSGKFHRNRTFDDYCDFRYHVNPPYDA